MASFCIVCISSSRSLINTHSCQKANMNKSLFHYDSQTPLNCDNKFHVFTWPSGFQYWLPCRMCGSYWRITNTALNVYVCTFMSSYVCRNGSVRQTITCAGSQTVAFLSRTHFFKANPLFRISAINSEGCIDGPVSTNHSLRVPLMSKPCQPLSPHSGNFRGGFVNRMGHQINSLHFRLSKSYNIILRQSSS